MWLTWLNEFLYDVFIITGEQIFVLINIAPKTKLFPTYHISKHSDRSETWKIA